MICVEETIIKWKHNSFQLKYVVHVSVLSVNIFFGSAAYAALPNRIFKVLNC